MLKAFIKVNIKSLHLLTYVFLLILLQIRSDALGQLDLPLGQLHMLFRQIHMSPGWLHSAIQVHTSFTSKCTINFTPLTNTY